MPIFTKKIESFSSVQGHAFKIIVSSSPSNPDALVAKISPGTVNNIIPSNIVSQGQLQNFSVQKDSLQHVILKCNSNGKTINSATIEVRPSAPALQTPAPFALPSQVEILIGAIYNTTVYQSVTDNISLGGYVQYLLPNEGSSLPYTVYLIWGTKFNFV